MNKTKIDLDNNLILRSENTEYNDDTLKSTLDNRFNYSTKEQKIGKWIDGKPLYRKVLSFNTTINSDAMYTEKHNINNVDFIWVSKAYFVSSGGVSIQLPEVGIYGTLEEKSYVYVDRETIYIYSNGGWSTGWSKIIILEYTKTTD